MCQSCQGTYIYSVCTRGRLEAPKNKNIDMKCAPIGNLLRTWGEHNKHHLALGGNLKEAYGTNWGTPKSHWVPPLPQSISCKRKN